ncbi:MAG: YdiY family protein [Planctomycetaceae bacterium]
MSVDVFNEELQWMDANGRLNSIPLVDIVRVEYIDQTASDPPDPLPFSPNPSPGPIIPAPEMLTIPTAPEDSTIVDPAAPQTGIEGDSSMHDPTMTDANGHWEEFCEWSCETFDEWTQRLELGARILRGNSEEEFVNLGGKFQKKTDAKLTQIDFSGQYGRNRSIIATNRWILNSNTDFNQEGNWIIYVVTKNEYDEFENLDYRGTLSSGLGYRFINEEKRKLIGRFGPGVTYEKFNSPSNSRTTPDMFAELESIWPLGASATYEHRTTVHPSISDFGIVRIVSSNGLLYSLDDKGRWQFKADLRWEYNSQPNPGRLRSDYTTNFSIVYNRG